MEKIIELFRKANSEGRDFLFEHETLLVLENLGIKVPRYCFSYYKSQIEFPQGNSFVIKIVAKNLVHKTGVDAVKVNVKRDEVIKETKKLLDSFPKKYSSWLNENKKAMPKEYSGFDLQSLEAEIRNSIKGVLITEFFLHDTQAGGEVQIGIKNDASFGPVVIFGIGGTQSDSFISNDKIKDEFSSIGIIGFNDDSLEIIRNAKTLKSLMPGNRRGDNALDIEKKLAAILSRLADFAKYFSILNCDAEYHIDRLEINPFSTVPDIVALDCVLQFSIPNKKELYEIECRQNRPFESIEYIVNPGSVIIAGISTSAKNACEEVLIKFLENKSIDEKNIYFLTLKPKELYEILQKRVAEPLNSRLKAENFFSSQKEMAEQGISADLLYCGVPGKHTLALVKETISLQIAKGIYIITAGFGETSSGKQDELEIQALIREKKTGTAIIGPNTVGNYFRDSNNKITDTFFTPPSDRISHSEKGNRNVALICQSGGLALSVRGALANAISPDLIVTCGNSVDMSHRHFIKWLSKNHNNLDVFAFYIESFKELEGLDFCSHAKQLFNMGKSVIVYKAGRSPEGASATETHTGKAAGEFHIAKAAFKKSGIYLTESFEEFTRAIMLSSMLAKKEIPVLVPTLGGLSNAGYEKCSIADSMISLHGERLFNLGNPQAETVGKINTVLDRYKAGFIDQKGSIFDLSPLVDTQGIDEIMRILLSDTLINACVFGIVPYVPVLDTLPGSKGIFEENSLASRIIRINKEFNKPFAVSVSIDKLYDPMVDEMLQNNVPVFRSVGSAALSLGKFLKYKRNI
ncbi:MAG: acetate--CoA ligase family protein [archaeon]